MSSFLFLRRPVKLIVLVVLLALTSGAALIFSLQYLLDGLVMEHSMNSAAYVGTVYSRLQEAPMLQTLPQELVTQLEESEYVDRLMVRRTRSGKAAGLQNVRDGYGTREILYKHFFMDGVVESTPALEASAFGIFEQLTVKIRRNWAGNWSSDRITVHVIRTLDTETPKLQQGDRIFFVGRFYPNGGSHEVHGAYLIDPEELPALGAELDSVLLQHSLLKLPQNLPEAELDAYIAGYMAQTGLDRCCECVNQLYDVFTVHEVEDMSMLLTVADKTTFLTEGRELRESDTGSQVCVINQAVARKNGLKLGDRISLALTEGCYTSTKEQAGQEGFESGFPFEPDPWLEYRDRGGFEIVGIYSELGRGDAVSDTLHFTRNDIFIPYGSAGEPEDGPAARPYTLSFRVLGPDYEGFMDAFEVSLHEQGYSLSIVDTGWEDFSDSFYALEHQRRLMLGCALTAYLAAIVLYVVLLHRHFSFEFGLRRLLGASAWEAREIFLSGFLVTAAPAGILSAAGSYGAYILWMKGKLTEHLPAMLPDDRRLACMLLLWVCAELAAAWLLMMVFVLRTEKHSLLKLIRSGRQS